MCASRRNPRSLPISRASGANMIWLTLPASADLSTWKSSMTISADRQAGRWRALASIAWSHGFAPARSARFYASTRRDLPATVEIGITCSNCAGLSTPASSISTAFTIPAGPMIACFWA